MMQFKISIEAANLPRPGRILSPVPFREWSLAHRCHMAHFFVPFLSALAVQAARGCGVKAKYFPIDAKAFSCSRGASSFSRGFISSWEQQPALAHLLHCFLGYESFRFNNERICTRRWSPIRGWVRFCVCVILHVIVLDFVFHKIARDAGVWHVGLLGFVFGLLGGSGTWESREVAQHILTLMLMQGTMRDM